MYLKCKTPKSKVICYNVDSITMTHVKDDIPERHELDDEILDNGFKKELNEELSENDELKEELLKNGESIEYKEYSEFIGSYVIEGCKYRRQRTYKNNPEFEFKDFRKRQKKYIFEKHMSMSDFKELLKTQKRYCLCGPPGGGKSHYLVDTCNKKSLILSFTNKSVNENRHKLQKINKKVDCLTLSKAIDFSNDNENVAEKLRRIITNYSCLYIDEFLTIPYHLMKTLYYLHLQGLQIRFFGDYNQLLAVSDHPLYYPKLSFFLDMIDDTFLVVDYKEKYSRYDIKWKKELDYFLENKKMPDAWKDKKEKDCDFYITKYNGHHDCVPKLNKKVCERLDIKRKSQKGTLLIYDKSKGNENDKYLSDIDRKAIENNLFQSELYTVIKECQNTVLLSDEYNTFYITKRLLNRFEYGYALTCYKYQGSEVSDNYCIKDINKMDFREAYSSLSRVGKNKNVYFKYTDKVFKYDEPIEYEQCYIKPFEKFQDKRFKDNLGKIYGVYCDDELVYIGCTHLDINERFEQHLNSKDNDKFHKFVRENKESLSVKLIKECQVCNFPQLKKIEESFVHQYRNKKLLNTEYNRNKMVTINKNIPEVEIRNTVVKVYRNKKEKILYINLHNDDGKLKQKNFGFAKIGMDNCLEKIKEHVGERIELKVMF